MLREIYPKGREGVRGIEATQHFVLLRPQPYDAKRR